MAKKNNPFQSENYKKNIDEKPSGWISRLFDTLKRILGIDSVKNLPQNSSQVATKTSSKTVKEENPLYVAYRRDSGYGSPLDEGPEYEEIPQYQEKIGEKINPQSSEQTKKEPTYAKVPKKYIEEKRKLKQQEKQQEKPKPLIPPKPLPQVPEKITSAPKVNWATYPGDVENVQKANKIPPSPQPKTHKPKEQIYSTVSKELSKEHREEQRKLKQEQKQEQKPSRPTKPLIPPQVPEKTPDANKIGKYIYGHQNPKQLSIILEKKLFDMAARNNLSENNIKFLQSRSAKDIFELKNPEGKTALEIAEKANKQFMHIAYSKLEGIEGDNQEISRKFNELDRNVKEKGKENRAQGIEGLTYQTVKERAKSFEALGTKHDTKPRAHTDPPSTKVNVRSMVKQLERGKVEGRQ